MQQFENGIEQFLYTVCEQVCYKKIHSKLSDELRTHIYDQKSAYMNKGMDEEQATQKAIEEMGDPIIIGRQLNQTHKPKTEWSLIGLTAIIAIIGGIIMYTSSKFESMQAVNFGRYLLFSVIGIGFLIGLYFFDYTKLKKLSLPLYLIGFTVLFLTLLIGNQIQGRRLLLIGNVLIPSDYATLLFIIAFAGFMEKSRGKGVLSIIKVIGLAVLSLLPVMALPNLSQAIILIVGYATLIILAVIKDHFCVIRKLQILSLLAFMGVAITSITLLLSQYRFERFITFVTRGKSDPMGEGWQQIQADKWLSVSHPFGKTTETVSGYKIDFGMPGLTSDYVLINVISTLGWIVGIAIVMIIALLIFRMIRTTKKIKNEYGFYLSLAACSVLSAQFIISILINFNLFPLMSVNLPFVSYGGIGYIVNMMLVGIILSVWRRNNLIEKSPITVIANRETY
ncbi:MAG TPA: FtsW/RodA/SpoVE family cell cycle protein [Clostridia bacterium]|nr:FtsW/RodA/SpoVE family cell cycle protein [Clostridia bacterium]